MVFGWDRKNGVPLQSLYDFARVFVPAGQSVSVTLNATALDFTQVLALAWRHALLLLLLLFIACRRCCWYWLVLVLAGAAGVGAAAAAAAAAADHFKWCLNLTHNGVLHD